jgi:hypothetical protein
MRNFKYVPTVLRASVLLLVAVGTCTRSKAADPCDLSVVPQEVRAKIAKDYADWQPERLEQLDEEDRAMWIKAHPDDCPGIAIGHFESKTEFSFAFLLVSKPDRKRPGLRILVFSRSDVSAPYVPRTISKWNVGPFYENSNQVIATVPPGHYEEAQGPHKVQTDLDGISYEVMEKGTILYYWKNGRYQGLATSD